MSKCHLFFCSAAILLPVGIIASILAVTFSHTTIENEAAGHHFDESAKVPVHEVALVLGCSEFLSNGQTNLYFRYRIETAAEAYHEGKCRFLIVSGDNSRVSYNEPESMRAALIRQGVPSSRILEDFAGFRTLDSVVRARAVFGQEKLLVISQRFHNERAIYIGRQRGIELTGLNAPDVSRYSGWKTKTREKLARVKTLMDLHLLHGEPKFLGERVVIGELASSESDR
jgi:SanA protein